MSQSQKPVPTYRLHKQSGQAVVTVRLPDGRRHDVYLGNYGSADSKREYARIVAELKTGPAAALQIALPPAVRTGDLSVSELLDAFWDYAEDHYRKPDGSPGHELTNYSLSVKCLRDLYDDTAVRDFGPLRLKAVRHRMIEGTNDRAGLCRRVVNQRIGRIKNIFKWAVSEELCPPDVYHALQTVTGLRQGKTAAKDHAPVKPVSDDVFDATLPHCPRPIAAMLRLLRLTGMRPGELVIMRPQDLDTTGPVWTYKPTEHKTASRGRDRAIYLGSKAQLILRPYLTDCPPTEFVFSPYRERAKRYAEIRAKRKTPVQPSQQDRSKAKPKKLPGHRYRVGALSRAVWTACEVAGLTKWFPYQLRHSAASEFRRDYGLEAAQVLLGHSRADVTQVYAERDHGKAIAVARAIG